MQIDNSLENQYYEIIFKTINNKFKNMKAVKILIEYSYNQMGNIMFINKLLCNFQSDIILNLDGIILFELWNLIQNVNKLNENNNTDSLDEDIENVKYNNKVKILTNKVQISKINLVMSFKPSFKMMKNMSKAQRILFFFSKVENLQLIFDKFESQGTRSLETISTILSKNFMKKYSTIITKFLLSIDLIFNVSNVFTNFKYGLDSMLDSMSLKRSHSISRVPRRMIIGLFRFVGFVLLGVNSSIKKILDSVRDLTNYYFGYTMPLHISKELTTEDLSKRWYIYDAVINRKPTISKNMYFFYTRAFSRGNEY
jgi:hypothetical protein